MLDPVSTASPKRGIEQAGQLRNPRWETRDPENGCCVSGGYRAMLV
jgi:hypothetical protein